MRFARTKIIYYISVFTISILVTFIALGILFKHNGSHSNNNPSSPELMIAVNKIFQNGNKLHVQGHVSMEGGHGNNVETSVVLDLPHNKSFKYKLKKFQYLPLSSFPQSKYFVKPWRSPGIDCAALIHGSVRERLIAIKKMESPRPLLSSDKFVQIAKNCNYFKHMGRYVTHYLTEEERDFPIAYSILVFNNTEQFHKLLRAIYRPQNYYCVHVDAKADPNFRLSIQTIADCFSNVFLSSRSVDVQWGEFTVLEPELICMEDLLKKKSWKYFINLTGQEYPLRTNYEMVKILKALHGANEMETTVQRANTDRWEMAGPPPSGITPVKGSVHITVNRKFVHYAVHNPISKTLLDWVKKTEFPDETFFATLNSNPHLQIPGSYKGDPETDKYSKPFITRFKNWGGSPADWPCSGQRVRAICIFGVGDLPLLASRPEFFANKFYIDYQHLALECMEEVIFNRTRDEYFQRLDFDTTYYQNLDIVHNHV